MRIIRRMLRGLFPATPPSQRDVVRVEGPLERVGDRWLLRIPLLVGGRQLVASTRGIAAVKGDILEVEVPANLIKNLGLMEGQRLWVHNEGGRFTFEWEPDASSERHQP